MRYAKWRPDPVISNRPTGRRVQEADGGAGPSSGSGHGDLLNFAIQKEVRLGETESPTPPSEREDELHEGCRAEDLEAFEKLYQTNGPRMKSIALNLLGNVGDAEDAVQEAFLKIFRGAKAFRGALARGRRGRRRAPSRCSRERPPREEESAIAVLSRGGPPREGRKGPPLQVGVNPKCQV